MPYRVQLVAKQKRAKWVIGNLLCFCVATIRLATQRKLETRLVVNYIVCCLLMKITSELQKTLVSFCLCQDLLFYKKK